jgi:cytochrome c556
MIRTVVACITIIAGTSAVASQSDPIRQRNALMKSMWQDGFSVPVKMSRGQEPFDPAKVEAGLEKMSGIVSQLPPLWPANSKPPANPDTKYSSSLKIWENKPDFEAKLARLTKSIADNRGKAKDVDSLKGVVGAINQNCDNCHESYQVRNQ